MKNFLITIAFLVMFFRQLEAQNCETSIDELSKLIMRTLPVQDIKYLSKKSETYILEFKLNNSGDSIISADYWKRSNSVHDDHIEKLLKKIQSDWVLGKCDVERIVVQVFILFIDLKDEKIDYPLNFKEGAVYLPKDKGTYYAPGVLAVVHARRV